MRRTTYLFAALLALLGCAACKRLASKPTLPTPSAPSGLNYVDLGPLTEIRIQNAYFKEASQHRLEDYIGTQDARFRVELRRGLRLLGLESALPRIPVDQPPASDLVPQSMRRFQKYRYYYAVVFAHAGRGQTGSAVLLGANSAGEMEKMGAQLKAVPESVCNAASPRCAIFPKTCTVSLELTVTVNGVPKVLGWGARLSGIAPADKILRLTRTVNGRDVVSELDSLKARITTAVPGDRIQWE